MIRLLWCEWLPIDEDDPIFNNQHSWEMVAMNEWRYSWDRLGEAMQKMYDCQEYMLHYTGPQRLQLIVKWTP